MGKLSHRAGDVFNSSAKIIAHNVNCMGVFNAGFARYVAKLYPVTKIAYLDKFEHMGWSLGEIQAVRVNKSNADNPVFVINAAMQHRYGRTGKYINYEAVGECFRKIFHFADECGFDVACPKVGSGLAGGEWDKIEEIILEQLVGRKANLEVYTL